MMTRPAPPCARAVRPFELMKLHFNSTKAPKAGGALAIAIALGVAGCGSAHHLSQTTTEAAAPHARSIKRSAGRAHSHRHAARPQTMARTVSNRAAASKPGHKTNPSSHRHITRSAQPKTSTRKLKTPAHQHSAVLHQHAAATKRRSTTRSSRPSKATTRAGRTTMTPDGSGTAPATPLNANGAAPGGGQAGTAGSAGQGVSADG